MKKYLLLSVLAIFLPGCVSLNTISLTTVPAQRSHPVSAEASKFIVLGFNFDNDYVDGMVSELKQKCSNGVVSGILTKDEYVDYFLFIFGTHRVSANGYCVKGHVADNNTPADERQPASDTTTQETTP